ncbi:hypothetical protein [Snodgrassella communis]|jgi:hypothetical protein|uniref:hypothetical protein n=1 Tax=Snodgrassella communis TaxID=2946699 RepID=UPI000C1F76B2|nr:hypothetical protein [Snodgrassella communis]PIT09058.1 hypothetical protein BGI31_04270 [Snodgrassella communis]
MDGWQTAINQCRKTNAVLKLLAKETNTTINSNNHSRGSLTDKVSNAYLQNRLNATDIPIEKTKFLGPAANIAGQYKMLEKNGYIDPDGINSTLFLANNSTDFVGGLVGYNPVTAGQCIGSPLGSCYSHSSYNGAYELDDNLLDPFNNKYIDKNTQEPIRNPEFGKIKNTVEEPKSNANDRYDNPTLAQAVVIGADGNLIWLIGRAI